MTHTDYTKDLLNIKDQNINLYENYLETRKIKGIETKIIHAYLTYEAHVCPICKQKNSVIKWNWKRNCRVIIPKVSNYNSIVLLDKQRFKCKCCNHTFIAKSSPLEFNPTIIPSYTSTPAPINKSPLSCALYNPYVTDFPGSNAIIVPLTRA